MRKIMKKVAVFALAATMMIPFMGISASATETTDTVVAKVGEDEYTSFADAWDAVVTTGGTIDIQSDCEITDRQHNTGTVGSVTVNGNGYTLTVADDVTSNELFSTPKQSVVFENITFDGNGLTKPFVNGDYHMQTNGEVLFKNFAGIIYKGTRVQLNSGSTVTVSGCNTAEDYLFEIGQYGRITGDLVFTDCSANVALVSYNNVSSSWISSMTSDYSGCDIYGKAGINFGEKSSSTVKLDINNITLADDKTITFKTSKVTISSPINLTYEGELSDGLVLVKGFEDNSLFTLTNEGYTLSASGGNLVAKKTIDTASIDGTIYYSLEDAINAASSDSETTIKLLRDVELSSTVKIAKNIVFTADEAVTISSTGTAFSVNAGKNLTISENVTVKGSDTSVTAPLFALAWKDNAKVIIDNGAAEADVITASAVNGQIVAKNNASIKGDVYVTACYYYTDASSKSFGLRLNIKEYTGDAAITVKLLRNLNNDNLILNYTEDVAVIYGNKTSKINFVDDEYELVAKGSSDLAARLIPEPVSYTITIDGEEYTADYNAKVTVSETAKKFAYWEKNGKVVSTDATYSFYVWEDATITPIYNDDEL